MKIDMYEAITVKQEYNYDAPIDEPDYDMVVYMGDVEVHRKPVSYLPPSYQHDYEDEVASMKDRAVGEFAKRLLEVLK